MLIEDTIHYEVETISNAMTFEVAPFDSWDEAYSHYQKIRFDGKPAVLRKVITYSEKNINSGIKNPEKVLERLLAVLNISENLAEDDTAFEGSIRAKKACKLSLGLLNWVLHGGKMSFKKIDK